MKSSVKNVFFAKFMPISAAMAFDNTGAPYDITNILTPNATLDESKYSQYSPLYLPATYYLSYGAQFAAMTCVVVHTLRKHTLRTLAFDLSC